MTQMTPTQFEQEVSAHLRGMDANLNDLEVLHNQLIKAYDSTYQIDGCVTFRALGLEFKVLVECKRHSSPIKRNVVVDLYGKMQSIGAHKGVIYATTSFQKSAKQYADAHGIALITFIDGVTAYVSSFTGYVDPVQARKQFPDVPLFVGQWLTGDDTIYIEPGNTEELQNFIFDRNK